MRPCSVCSRSDIQANIDRMPSTRQDWSPPEYIQKAAAEAISGSAEAKWVVAGDADPQKLLYLESGLTHSHALTSPCLWPNLAATTPSLGAESASATPSLKRSPPVSICQEEGTSIRPPRSWSPLEVSRLQGLIIDLASNCVSAPPPCCAPAEQSLFSPLITFISTSQRRHVLVPGCLPERGG